MAVGKEKTDMIIREMTIADYEEVFALWQITSKRALSKADEKAKIESYLTRSEGMSKVAVIDGKIVGTVLASHDGRRGFCPTTAESASDTSLPKVLLKRLKTKGLIKLISSAIRTTPRVRASGRISDLKSVRIYLFFLLIMKM